jgi:hypothetical protein
LPACLAVTPARAEPSPTEVYVQARRDYGVCLQRVLLEKVADRLSAEAFTAEVKTACAAEETALVRSVAALGVANGTTRADAEAAARQEADDFLGETVDTYAAFTAPH